MTSKEHSWLWIVLQPQRRLISPRKPDYGDAEQAACYPLLKILAKHQTKRLCLADRSAMADADLDYRLIIFRRQYLQLFEPDFLAWPPARLLETADVQTWLCKNLFDSGRRRHLPPRQYQTRVLRTLISKINLGNQDPKDNVCNMFARSFGLWRLKRAGKIEHLVIST